MAQLGSYGFGLNIVLDARANALNHNSKRVDRTFRLTAVNGALVGPNNLFDNEWSLILGTERFDWFADYVLCGTILGNGALPHFIPGGGQIVEKGDFIVAKTKNLTATEKHIALLFQGILL